MPADKKLELTLFLVLLLTFSYFYQGGGANQNARLDMIRSIVELGQLNLKSFAGSHDIVRIDGKIYSNKAPGVSLVGVIPYYLVSRLKSLIVEISSPTFYHLFSCYLVTLLLVGLISAWGGVIFFRLLGLFHQEPVPRLICTFGLFLGTPVFSYSTSLYGHVPGLVLALNCFYLLYKYLVLLPTVSRARFYVFLAGLSGGGAVVFESPTAFIVAVLGLYCIVRAGLISFRRLIYLPFFLGGLLIPAIVLGGYNYLVFGHPLHMAYFNQGGLRAGYDGRPQAFFQIGPKTVNTLYQITFGPFRGFFHLAPFLILAFPGIVYFVRQKGLRSLMAVLWGVVLVYYFFTLLYPYWYGGKALGPRHSMEMLPYLVLLGFFFVIRFPRLSAVLAGVSIFFMLTATAVRPEEYVTHPFRDLYFPSFFRGALGIRGEPTFIQAGSFNSFNLGQVVGLHGQASLLPLYLVWIAGGLLMIRLSRKQQSGRPGVNSAGLHPLWGQVIVLILLANLALGVISLVQQSEIRNSLENLSETKTYRVPPDQIPPTFVQGQLTTGPFLGVWELMKNFQPGDGIDVKIQHAAAGREGGFHIVAYGDDNEDGKPDIELFRSPYLKARSAGDWSHWTIPAPEGRLFVGYAWEDETRVFYERSAWKHKDLSETMYYSNSPKGPPLLFTSPRAINMTVEVGRKVESTEEGGAGRGGE